MIFSLPIFEQWGKKEWTTCVCVSFFRTIYLSLNHCAQLSSATISWMFCPNLVFLKRQMVSLQLLAFSFLYLYRLCPLANGRYIFLMDWRETIEENVGQASYYVIWLFCAVYFIIDLAIKRHYGRVNLDFFNFGLTIFDTGNGAALGFFHALSGSREGEQVNSPQLDIHLVHFRVLEHKTKNRKRKKKR